MVDLLKWFRREKSKAVVAVDQLEPFAYGGQKSFSNWENSIWDGGKFSGGFGPTQVYVKDYWTLRARSTQLFNENQFAVGIIRRLITNEINIGLTPEVAPDEAIIGVPEDSLVDWSETVENRFHIWSKNPKLCDFKQESTFGAIQRAARMEALISGDVLIQMRQSQRTFLPTIRLISGSKVQTPLGEQASKISKGHKIIHGVELDIRGRVVAHWVTQDDLKSKRLPAFGEKTGRRLSWLVYGSDKRLDEVRGLPILSIVMQSLKEIDRYRDSAQRKAVVNSMLAILVKKTNDKPGTLPFNGGAVRRDTAAVTDGDGKKRNFDITNQIPGVVMQELQVGEEPVGFNSQIEINYGAFEDAILQGVAWSLEMPPEIMRLAFSRNYAGSQAAINEFKIYLNKFWMDFGETLCTPVYKEWLISEVLLQKIDAPGFLDAWRDPKQYDVFGAWTLVTWFGSVKPSTDMVKQAKGSVLLVENGWSTNSRESRMNSGTKFTRNIKRIENENKLKVAAARPMAEFKAEFGEQEANEAIEALDLDKIQAIIDDRIEENSDDSIAVS